MGSVRLCVCVWPWLPLELGVMGIQSVYGLSSDELPPEPARTRQGAAGSFWGWPVAGAASIFFSVRIQYTNMTETCMIHDWPPV